MAEKLQYIEELSLQTLKGLNRRENWVNYLKTASNHYKYSFRDSFLIYAQRPDAKAVASYDLWNNVMHRYVNRGSNGIALIDNRQGQPRLHYVFDVSDTNGDKIPFIWNLKDDYKDRVNQELADSFDAEADNDRIDITIDKVIDGLVEDNMPELLSELKYSKESSFLEELDDLNLEVMLRDTLRASIKTLVMQRCGYEIDIDELDSEFTEFNHLQNFNTNATMLLLGTATSVISEAILREIEISVKTIEREERSQQYGNDVQRSGRNNVSRDRTQRTNRQVIDQVRTDAEELSGEQSSGEVQPNDTGRNTVPPLQGSGTATQTADGTTDRPDEEADRESIPSDENSGNREPVNQGDDSSSLNEQNDIDLALLRGSGFVDGKQRIIDYYFQETSNTERAKFLKDEYGTGGGSITYSNKISGFVEHDAKGITLRNRYLEAEPLHLTWSKAAKRIGELIDNGQYFERRYENEKPLIKPTIDESIITTGADEAPFSMEENDPDISSEPKRKRRTQAEMNYARFQDLAPHIMDKRYRYAKLTSNGFMDLTVEWVGENRIAMVHYGEQNGDLMADPDMELIVDFDKKTIMPATYQNDYVNVYQQVYLDNNQWKPKLSKELTSFLSTWLRNIEFQSHVMNDAVYFNDDKAVEPIIFDEQGREHGHDIPHDIMTSAKLAELQAENEDTQKKSDVELPTSLPDKQNEMRDYGYEWDGMINLDDEMALKLFDIGYGIYLLHQDNTESLAESEKRLIQHINDGGLVGIEREYADFLEIPTENEILEPSNDEYKDLFESIIKQGDVSKTGKEKIVDLFNKSSDMTSFKADVREHYGDFWSEIRVDDNPIKWHISPDGLEVFINGLGEPSINYNWVDISDCIASLINADEYFEQDEYIQTTQKAEIPIESDDDRLLNTRQQGVVF